MKSIELKDRFKPKKLNFINDMLIEHFKAIPIPKNDARLSNFMHDPFIPKSNEIYGVYCIYRKSILGLLENKFKSFGDYEFSKSLTSDKVIDNDSFENVLDFSILVVISTLNNKTIASYYIGGASERLNSILNVCLGYPRKTNDKYYQNTIEVFLSDIKIVENMGYLENIESELV